MDINIIDDKLAEGEEQFRVVLSRKFPSLIIGDPGIAVVIIEDDGMSCF